ncbi:hypothetical protein T440DRAFT_11295 [Plenodomus tracheiphilus IPT5]|uniref:Uncharacterized protein n=1 Tax=Plenodomus tracheiphilus IPT5 TaxID=1408161 RepID=A0A6A7BN43_9PLEO|nr:hypothetical protein T440DRAFT_11295 [Plenodomus tracheiphilus IPT5]
MLVLKYPSLHQTPDAKDTSIIPTQKMQTSTAHLKCTQQNLNIILKPTQSPHNIYQTPLQPVSTPQLISRPPPLLPTLPQTPSTTSTSPSKCHLIRHATPISHPPRRLPAPSHAFHLNLDPTTTHIHHKPHKWLHQ